MRYVAVFACRDLFVDDMVLGAARRSPLAALEEATEELDLNRKIGALRAQSAPGMGSLPFAKLKKYSSKSAPEPNAGCKSAGAEPLEPPGKGQPAAAPAVMNRFVYLGRTRDMQILQKSKSPASMTEAAAACWRAKAARLEIEMGVSKTRGDSAGYAEYASRRRLVEAKLAETRVCETAASRLNSHLNKPIERVSEDFIDAYLTIQGCTGHASQPSVDCVNTDTNLSSFPTKSDIFRSAEKIWRSKAD
jgi:hypothetical protein